MKQRTTERPKRYEGEEETFRNERSHIGGVAGTLIRAVKRGLKALFLRPATWHWIMVRLPNLLENVEDIVEKIISFFTGFFT